MIESAQSPLAQALLMAAFVLHIGGGAVGLISGTVALFAAKGGRVHRIAGNVFFAAMLVMAAFAIYLAFAIPNRLFNAFVGTFTIYLVATAWVTIRRPEGTIGWFEPVALAVSALLCTPFLILSFQLAMGLPPMIRSGVPSRGPIVIAIWCFTAVVVIATASDAKLVLARGISGAPRIARHLWRMCLGLTLAYGSAFTNGFARLLPGPYHVPPAFFYPQFVPLLLMVFWMIRVRLTGWYRQHEPVGA